MTSFTALGLLVVVAVAYIARTFELSVWEATVVMGGAYLGGALLFEDRK